MVGMAAPYYRVAAGQATVQLLAQLDQPPLNSVTAVVSVELRTADGVSEVGVIFSLSCSWQAGNCAPLCSQSTGAQGIRHCILT